MITINGYTPKDIQPFPSSSDQAKILDARNYQDFPDKFKPLRFTPQLVKIDEE